MHGHHAPAEAALAGARGLLPAALRLERRLRRAPLLAADLQLLGLSPAEVAALPLCPMPAIREREQAWGLLYVLEGSALGGQLVARHVATLLGLDATNGAGGVVPHGAETGALWRDFKELLDGAAQSGDLDQQAVVEAANQAFARLDAWVGA
jgi:heme oxygenase